MPKTERKFRIMFLDNLPGASSLSDKLRLKDGQGYHDAVAEMTADTPSLIYGWSCSREDLPAGSIAYHPLFGSIRYGYSWWSPSTMELMDNLKAAEANPSISAHLLHIDSPGGEAFGLHEAFELIRSLKKPCYAVVESCAASAAYYLAAGCDKIFTVSKFSKVGSIGIMSVHVDDSEYLEKEGIKVTELYSHYSPLKNADFRKLDEGETEDFIKKYLDPLAKAFIEDVQAARKKVADDSDALKGEVYLAEEAETVGLIDGVKNLDDVVAKLAAKIEVPAPAAPSRDINTIF